MSPRPGQEACWQNGGGGGGGGWRGGGGNQGGEAKTTCAFRLMISLFEVSFTTFLKGSGHKRGGGGNRGGGGGGRNSARAHASASVSVNVNANAYASSGGGGGNRSPSRGGGGRLSYLVINNWPLSDHSGKVVEGSASQTGEVIIIIMGEDETEALVVVEVVEVLAQECHHFLQLSAGGNIDIRLCHHHLPHNHHQNHHHRHHRQGPLLQLLESRPSRL